MDQNNHIFLKYFTKMASHIYNFALKSNMIPSFCVPFRLINVIIFFPFVLSSIIVNLQFTISKAPIHCTILESFKTIISLGFFPYSKWEEQTRSEKVLHFCTHQAFIRVSRYKQHKLDNKLLYKLNLGVTCKIKLNYHDIVNNLRLLNDVILYSISKYKHYPTYQYISLANMMQKKFKTEQQPNNCKQH